MPQTTATDVGGLVTGRRPAVAYQGSVVRTPTKSDSKLALRVKDQIDPGHRMTDSV